ncbi:MAG: HAMP domain-containing histidine kinase [Clostridia bacterium]|nr:HAMP domain-containing histidine kinase [Clostridia bacterium]
MRSVRQKLFIQVGVLVLLLVGLTVVANNFCLESYYTSQLKDRLVEYYETINSIESSAYEEELKQFIDIESSSNVDIMIVNIQNDILYTSNSYFLDEKMMERIQDMQSMDGGKFAPMFVHEILSEEAQEKRGPEPPKDQNHPPMKLEELERVNNSVTFYYAYGNPLFDNKMLVLAGTLNSGDIIELKVPVVSIQSSIDIMNRFTIICGVMLLIVAFAYAYILSSTFTRPITEINATTKEIKELKFGHKCEVQTSDEIGELAANINDMSDVLSEAIDSMNQKNDQLENLVNNVSHELKTPLALLQGYAEGIQRHIGNDEVRARFYSEVIVDEAKKMNRIVESLLTIKQLETDEMTLFYKDFSITELISKTIEKYHPILEKEGLNIEFLEGPDDVLVFGDAFYTEQVLINYVSNAMQYVEAPYKISIDLEVMEDICRVNVFNSFEHTQEEVLKPIWDEFYKLDKARTREKGGHGLGLSIVKSIQEAHHQAYGVKSEAEGITFWFDVLRRS